ncbi:MAG: hypothetical protein IH624_00700 [Phycisphaerae bacterium]|nr:hypothetical protein [Phycisphaerae bacterium]
MSKTEIIKDKAKELAQWFWHDLGEQEGQRAQVHLAFVISDGLDPDSRRVRRTSTTRVSKTQLSEALKVQNKIGLIIDDAVALFAETTSVGKVRELLNERQHVWQNIRLAESCQELENHLAENFEAGDNFVDVNSSWCIDGEHIIACYTSYSQEEGYF